MDELYIIKKYKNRRLYDTRESRYVTLADIKKLVMEETPFKVIDAASKEDLTHVILLQIITANEETGANIFSIGTMQNIIRSYGASVEDLTRNFLEKSMEFFVAQNPLETNPLTIMSNLTQQNIAMWQSMMGQKAQAK